MGFSPFSGELVSGGPCRPVPWDQFFSGETPALISVCVPVYNGGKYLGAALQSVLDQSYPRLELIVQDNNSTDSTPDVIQSFASLHPSISPERNVTTVGMAANWNLALRRSKGDYVLLMSADDLLREGFFQRCLAVLRGVKPEVDAVTCNHFFLSSEGARRQRKVFVREGVYHSFSARVILQNPFPFVFSLYRRSAVDFFLKKGKLFNENASWACDYDLILRFSESGKRLAYIREPLTEYRVHGNNLSSNVPRMNRLAARVLIRHRKKLITLCPWAYRLTLIRFALRVFRDRLMYGVFDSKILKLLFRSA